MTTKKPTTGKKAPAKVPPPPVELSPAQNDALEEFRRSSRAGSAVNRCMALAALLQTGLITFVDGADRKGTPSEWIDLLECLADESVQWGRAIRAAVQLCKTSGWHVSYRNLPADVQQELRPIREWVFPTGDGLKSPQALINLLCVNQREAAVAQVEAAAAGSAEEKLLALVQCWNLALIALKATASDGPQSPFAWHAIVASMGAPTPDKTLILSRLVDLDSAFTVVPGMYPAPEAVVRHANQWLFSPGTLLTELAGEWKTAKAPVMSEPVVV